MEPETKNNWTDLASRLAGLEEKVDLAARLETSQRHELLLEMANLEYGNGELDRARGHFNQILKESNLPEHQVEAKLGLAWIAYTRSSWTESEDTVRDALELSHSRGLKAGLLVLRGLLAYRQGRYEKAIRDAKKVLELESSDRVAGFAHSSLGIVYDAKQQGARAHEQYTLGLELARRSRSPELGVRVLNNLGAYHFVREEYKEAMGRFQESIDISRSSGYRVFLGFPLLNLAGTYLTLGDPKRGLETLQEAGRYFRQVGDTMMLGVIEVEQGRLYRLQRDHRRSATHLGQALKYGQDCGAQRNLVLTYRERGLLNRDRHDWSEAISDLRLARELAIILKEQVLMVEIERYLNECMDRRE